MNSVLDIIAKINKAWNDQTIVSGDLLPECERISMGSLSADYATNGGAPLGKMISITGENSAGKTVVACQLLHDFKVAFPDKKCFYFDAENTLIGQTDFLGRMTGLQPTDFYRYDCFGKAAEEIFKDMLLLADCDDIGMMVIDSIPTLVTKAELDNDFDKDNGQRAAVAKPLAKFCRQMLGILQRRNIILVCINQTRVVGTLHNGAKIYDEPGGFAMKYYPSLVMRLAQRKFTFEDTLDISSTKAATTPIDGFCISFVLTKSRVGAINRGGKFIYRFESGLDTMSDLLDIITTNHIAKLEGKTWYIVNPYTGENYTDENGEILKFYGRPKLEEYFRNNPQFAEEYRKVVSDYINKIPQLHSITSDAMAEVTTLASLFENNEEPSKKKTSKDGMAVALPSAEDEVPDEFKMSLENEQ